MYKSFPTQLTGSQTLTGVAKQIALPHEFAPQRFPSFPALERTALMAFNAPLTMNLGAAVQSKVMLARQAAFPLWGDPTTLDSGLWSYVAVYQGTATLDGASIPMGALIDWSVGANSGSSTMPVVAGSVKPPALYPTIGIDTATGALPWVWVDDTACLFAVKRATALATALDVEVTFEVWDSPGQTHLVAATKINIAANKVNQAGTVPAINAWVRPAAISALSYNVEEVFSVAVAVSNGTVGSHAVSATGYGTFTYSGAARRGFIPLTASSEFAVSPLPWFSTRLTAVGSLFTNITQVLNKAGSVLCGRVNPAVMNPFTVASGYVTSLHPAEKQFLPLETGAYTYCPPSTDMASFYDYTANSVSGSVPDTPVYRLDNASLVNVLFFNSPVAESLAVNLDWHIEFRTSSTLFQIGLSTLTLEQLHQAQLALVSAGFFYPNSTHKAALVRAMKGIGTYVRKVMPMAAYLPGLPGRVAQAANLIMSPAPQRKTLPKTTARGSGIAPRIKVKRQKKVKVQGKKKQSKTKR
jgi:hypothetical protein